MDREPVRDGFFHHESFRREDLCELIGDPARVNGFLSAANGRFFFPRGLSFLVTAAPRFCAPGRVAVTLGDSFLDGFDQILHGAFDLTREDLIDRPNREDPSATDCRTRLRLWFPD